MMPPSARRVRRPIDYLSMQERLNAAGAAAFAEGHRRSSLGDISAEVIDEVERARAKHGDQTGMPDGTGPDARFALFEDRDMVEVADFAEWVCNMDARNGDSTRANILIEEVCEALAEEDLDLLRAELVQVAAMALAWIYDIDLRSKT